MDENYYIYTDQMANVSRNMIKFGSHIRLHRFKATATNYRGRYQHSFLEEEVEEESKVSMSKERL